MEPGTTALGWVRFYTTVLWPARVRHWWHDGLPWFLAWRLPRKVALFAFVRVYSVLGDCDRNYDTICKLWERGEGR